MCSTLRKLLEVPLTDVCSSCLQLLIVGLQSNFCTVLTPQESSAQCAKQFWNSLKASVQACVLLTIENPHCQWAVQCPTRCQLNDQ